MTIMFLAVAAVVTSIVLGNVLKVNMGIIAATFAVTIGCLMLKMNMSELIALLPIRILFTVFVITAFYGFLVENGTLDTLVDRIVYPFRKKNRLIPFAVFLLTALLAASGVGAPSATIIVAPLAMSLAVHLRVPSLVLGTAVAFGASLGGNFVYSQGGIIGSAIIDQGVYAGQGNKIMMIGFLFSLLFYIVWFVIVYTFKYRLIKPVQNELSEKPKPLNTIQKRSVVLLLLVLLLVTVNAFGLWDYNFDISFLFLIGVGIATVIKLADFNAVLQKHIPLKMLVLLGGMTMLIGVTVDAGFVDYLAGLMDVTKMSRYLIAPVIALIAGTMSLSSSSISVVMPLMFPLVPQIATDFLLPPELLYSAIFVASTCAGIAPFDTGGNLVLSNCKVPSEIEKMQSELLIICFACIASSAVLFLLASLFWL